MTTTYYLACDLGLESGRIILGSLSKGQLTLKEIHPFPIKTHLNKEGLPCWDLVFLEKEIFAGIEKAARLDLPISGLSANSWGGDYVLLDTKDRPLQSPACGETGRRQDETARLLKKLPLTTIYAETGIPLAPLHTLFQIEAEQLADPTLFQRAQRFLPIADYLNTCFSGVAACEESQASTTQLYNPQTHAWSPKLVAALDLPDSILPRLVPSGTAFGPVVDKLRRYPALLNTRVVATCSHDTAAAIAAIPARTEQTWAYLHSDTRSQFGVELTAPILSSQACDEGFTNEVGLGGSIHFLKNSVGLGIVQECRRDWSAAGPNDSEEQLTRLAVASGPAKAHLSPEDPRFREPGNMPEKIAAYCRETGQPVPVKPGEFVRMILESLALAHAETLRQLEALTGQEIDVLHLVGRGAQNELLNQLTADATGLPVMVGPAGAAAIGNILIQALALWHLKSPDHLRSIVSSSFPTQILKPGPGFEKKVRDKFRALGRRLDVPQPLALSPAGACLSHATALKSVLGLSFLTPCLSPFSAPFSAADALRSYIGMNQDNVHQVIDHAICYAKGHFHTNGLENFWCLLKRALKGTYVNVEPFICFDTSMSKPSVSMNGKTRMAVDSSQRVKAFSGRV